MPRIRTVKPQFFLNEQLAELPPLARLLFIGLWVIADKEGRLFDRPKRIKAEVFPYDDFDVDIGLNNLAEKGFILRYIHRGKHWGSTGEAPGKHRGSTGEAPTYIIQIINFKKHQRISGKEAEVDSLFPPPDDFQQVNTGEAPGKHRGSIGEAPGKHWGLQERSTGKERITGKDYRKGVQERSTEEEKKDFVFWANEKNNFLNDEEWSYKFCTEKKIEKKEYDRQAKNFINDIELKEDFKDAKELKRHFTNWYNKNKKHGNFENTNKNGTALSGNSVIRPDKSYDGSF